MSPLARPAVGIEPATAAAAATLTATNHRAPADPPTNPRPPAVPAANHSSLADAVANHEPPSPPSANHHMATAYPAASERVPDVVAAAGPSSSSSSSSSSSGTGSPEHYPCPPGLVNGGTKQPITSEMERNSTQGPGVIGLSANGERPSSNQFPETSVLVEQSSVVSALEGGGSTGPSEKVPAAVISAVDLNAAAVSAEDTQAGVPSVEETVPQPVVVEQASSVTAQITSPGPTPPSATEQPAINSTAPDVVAGPDTMKSVLEEPTTTPPDVISRDPPSGPGCGTDTRAEAGPVDHQVTPSDSSGADTTPVSDCPAQKLEPPPSSAAAPAAPDVTKVPQEAVSPRTAPVEPPPATEPLVPPTAGSPSSLLAQVAAAPSPPVTPPTSAATGSEPTPPNAAPGAVPTPAADAGTTEHKSETVADSEPKTEPEPKAEPVRFQPADDVSDSELETYLDQLEDDSAPGEPPADSESFGGARPKTSPAAAAVVEPSPPPPPSPPPAAQPPEPPGAALQPLKGGVISRLQSQVSIECEVDSRSSRAAAAAAETGRDSPPPAAPPPAAPVRPSSLDLPSRSQSIAEQPTGGFEGCRPGGGCLAAWGCVLCRAAESTKFQRLRLRLRLRLGKIDSDSNSTLAPTPTHISLFFSHVEEQCFKTVVSSLQCF